MEELGMPILHTGGAGGTEGNSHMFPDNLTSVTVGRPAWDVDFWLFDIRVWLDVIISAGASFKFSLQNDEFTYSSSAHVVKALENKDYSYRRSVFPLD